MRKSTVAFMLVGLLGCVSVCFTDSAWARRDERPSRNRQQREGFVHSTTGYAEEDLSDPFDNLGECSVARVRATHQAKMECQKKKRGYQIRNGVFSKCKKTSFLGVPVGGSNVELYFNCL